MMSGHRTFTIEHKNNQGLATLVGLVAVVILTRLWWTGELAEWSILSFRSMRGDVAPSSVSYIVVGFLANLIWGVGTALVMIWSGVWVVISDIIAGVRMWSADRAAQKQIDSAITGAAVAADIANGPLAVLPGQKPEPPVNEDPLVTALKTIDGNIQQLAGRIDSLAERVTVLEKPKPATRTRTATKK